MVVTAVPAAFGPSIIVAPSPGMDHHGFRGSSKEVLAFALWILFERISMQNMVQGNGFLWFKEMCVLVQGNAVPSAAYAARTFIRHYAHFLTIPDKITIFVINCA